MSRASRRAPRIHERAQSPTEAEPLAAVAVAVDVVAFTLRDGRLHAALVALEGQDENLFAFPGGRVRPEESLDVAARRCIERHIPAHEFFVEQLYAFGEPHRDPSARVVSVAYLALVPNAGDSSLLRWYPAEELPPLAYDHGAVAEQAIERLRGKLRYTNIAFGLLCDPFTLADLQRLYEAILGQPLDRRNFRKKILGLQLVEGIGSRRRGPHRPAELFRFAQRRLAHLETPF